MRKEGKAGRDDGLPGWSELYVGVVRHAAMISVENSSAAGAPSQARVMGRTRSRTAGPFVAATVLPVVRRPPLVRTGSRAPDRQGLSRHNGPSPPASLRCAAAAPSTYSTLPLASVRRRDAVGFARRPTNAGQEPADTRTAPRVQQPRAAPSELRAGGWTARQGCESRSDQWAQLTGAMRLLWSTGALPGCCREGWRHGLAWPPTASTPG